MARFFKISQPVMLIFVVFLIPGCGQKESDLSSETLIRVGDRKMTVLDFKTALEFAKTAHDSNIKQHPEDLRKAKYRLINQLTVEMVLLERAEEIDISVTDAELEQAVAEIKGDYPEGEFEETLLENAISYDSWRNRLRTRLIIERVIEQDLNSQITITAEEIATFYKQNYQDRETENGSGQNSRDINELIVKLLRRQKAEKAYETWIEQLRSKYEIEINNQLWEEIVGFKSKDETETNLDKSKKAQ
jgi:hypothetical protein